VGGLLGEWMYSHGILGWSGEWAHSHGILGWSRLCQKTGKTGKQKKLKQKHEK